MKGFMKDDKFHPIRDTKGVRKSRDQSTKQEGIKIRKQRMTVSSSHDGIKIPTELVSDTETEQLYKVKGVIAEPMTTRKYPSNIFVHIIDMEEATGENLEPDKKYVGEVIMMPQWRYIHPKLKEDVADSVGMSVEEFEKFGADKGDDRWVQDMMGYTGGIRLGEDESGADPDELRQRLANKAPAYAGMIGFFLDSAWNRIGTTGWDSLNHLTKNRNLYGDKF